MTCACNSCLCCGSQAPNQLISWDIYQQVVVMHVYKHTYPLYKQKAIDIAIHCNNYGVMGAYAQGQYIHSTSTKLIGVPQSPMKISHYTAFHDIFELHTRVYKTILNVMLQYVSMIINMMIIHS